MVQAANTLQQGFGSIGTGFQRFMQQQQRQMPQGAGKAFGDARTGWVDPGGSQQQQQQQRGGFAGVGGGGFADAPGGQAGQAQNPRGYRPFPPAPTGDFPTVPKQHRQGMANYYDDSYLQLLNRMQGQEGQPGVGGAYQDILANFQGDPKALREFLDVAAPFIATQMMDTPAYKATQQFGKYSNLMPAYGAGAGQIARGVREGTSAGMNQLARSGLGRSSARSALAGQMQAAGGEAQANLFSRLYQQQQQTRYEMAQQAFDVHRGIGQIALGQNPGPRISQGSGGGGGLGSIGAGVGAILGSFIAPGVGTAAGANIGGQL